jgi:hypothetical protein
MVGSRMNMPMNAIKPEVVGRRPLASRYRWPLLVAVVAMVGCGRQSGLRSTGSGGSSAGATGGAGGARSSAQGGSVSQTGGAAGGSSATFQSQGGSSGPVGDASSSSGDVAAEASCDTAPLWHAVAFSAFSAVCSPNPAGVAYIVLDGEGRVVDNSMYAGDPVSLQTWLDSLGTQRWPCIAGQTIHYSCLSI